MADETQAALPSLAGEIWLAVKANMTVFKEGFADGVKQATDEATGQISKKLPTALGDAGDKGGTALTKGVTAKLPAITDAVTTEAAKLPAVMGQAGDKSGTALTKEFSKSLPTLAADTSKAIEKAGEEGGRRGGRRGGDAFGDAFGSMSRQAIRGVSDNLADSLGIWPQLLDPFTNAMENVSDTLIDKLPSAADIGGSLMETALSAAGEESAAAIDATLTAAGAEGAEGFGSTFSPALPAATAPGGTAAAAALEGELAAAGAPAAVGFGAAFSATLVPEMAAVGAAGAGALAGPFAAAGGVAGAGFLASFTKALGPLGVILGSVAGGNWIVNQITGSDNGLFSFPDIPGELKKTWEEINGTRNPNTGELYPVPDPNAPPPLPPTVITTPEPPPGYRRRKDDVNKYEPIPPGEPGYVDPNAPAPPPFTHIGEGIPVPPPEPEGPKPWWTNKLPTDLPDGTPRNPVHVKPPGGGGGGGEAGGQGAHTAGYNIDQWLLAQVPTGVYGTGEDLSRGLGDCSSAIEDLIDMLKGLPTAGRTLSTGSADSILPGLGFVRNYSGANIPGEFNIGFNSEHMQATLPGGTNFNWGSDAAARARGQSGGGAFDPSQGFTEHWSKKFGSVPSSPTGTAGDPVHTKDMTPKEKEDANAKALGKGLVDGVFEALGIDGSVFEDFRNWGIWKTAMTGVGDVAAYAKSINPAPGSQAESFFAGMGQALGLPDGMGSRGGGGGSPLDPANVTAWLPNSQHPDGGPPGPRGPEPGPGIGVQDNRRYDIDNHYPLAPPLVTPPASAGQRPG